MDARTSFATWLRDGHASILTQWAQRFEQSPLRLPRGHAAANFAGLIATVIDSLAVAVDGGVDGMKPGSQSTRGLEQASAFIGAHVATTGATGFDVAASLYSLRELVISEAPTSERTTVHALFEWLVVLALDAFASAGIRSEHERAAEQLEIGTPVFAVTADIPALILVGEPPSSVLDALFARTLLQVIATSGKTLIIDVSGLALPARPVLIAAFARFCAHPRVAAVQLALIGVTGDARREWASVGKKNGVAIEAHDRFESAFLAAIERSDRALIRRGS